MSDTHSYNFVSGTGDTNNTSFTLSGSELILNISPDFEVQSSYSVRIQTNDGNGGSFQKIFTVNISDLDEVAPIVTLTGSGTMNIEITSSYAELGASWTDNYDGTGTLLTANTGSVDINTIGSYTLEYSYNDAA